MFSIMTQEIKTPTVLNMADLVAYQDETVVSRTMIKKKTGTVTVFAFDEGQSLS